MSLFDDLAEKAAAALRSHPRAAEVGQVVELFNAHGVDGLIARFHTRGLDALVASWISRGDNLPISREQIVNVLGNERLDAVAKALGVPALEAAHKLAEVLPQVVDRLTPDGQLPPAGVLDKAIALLKEMGK
jgi:uncharacterized protein YidB (DUF937 family)